MKKISSALLIAAVCLSLGSCRKVIGEGPVVSQTRSTADFSSVELGVPAEMIFIPSDHNEVVIDAQQNILDLIDTYVSGGELMIKVRNSVNFRARAGIRITIRAASMHGLTINGSGSITVAQPFQPDNLKLRVNGSGNISANNIIAGQLDVSINGSGKIEVLGGTVGHEDMSISGSGDIDLMGIEAESAATQTSGSGTTRVFVHQNLDVHISGSGNVYYKGSPTVNTHISGSGNVVKLD